MPLSTYCHICLCLLLGNSIVAQNIVVKPFLQDAEPTSIIVMWEVDDIGEGAVNYGFDPFSLDNSITSNSIIGSGTSHIHSASINSLLPATKYYYKVEMIAGQLSQLYHFTTPSVNTDKSPTRLVAISDMQRDGSHPNKFKEIVEQGIIPIVEADGNEITSQLDAILIPGDLVPTGGSYSQWADYFFAQADSIFPYIPVYPVPGNHEYSGGGLPNFLKYFSLPENGPSSLPEQCWYKDISNVRIIGLNSNSGTTDQNIQLDWLSQVLDQSCNSAHIDFVFAQLHHPFKSELWTPGENDFTGKVIDSLEQFTSSCNKASIHFFGHTHGYSRGQSRDHKHLWINVATAGGAIDNWGEFPNADYEEFVKSQDEYGFVMVDVEAGSEPSFTIKRYSRGDQDVIIENVLRDSLSIYKNTWPPESPENLYPRQDDTIQRQCLILKGSAYDGIDGIIQASHWEIATGGNFTDSLVRSAWFQDENFYNEVNLQANDDLTDVVISGLEKDKAYQWRVRYRNQQLDWSPWSEHTTFYLLDSSQVITGNLLQNEGAEDGITNWSGDIESLENAECNSISPFQGTHNFGVGGVCANESTVGIAEQTIDLTAYNSQISQGEVSIRYGGYMRNFNGSDVPEIYVEAYDNIGLISTSEAISNDIGTWTYKESTFELPATTISCKMILKGTRNSGTDNDSYFDELYLGLETIISCSNCYGSTGIDEDNDGFCDDIDCDDKNNRNYPGAEEMCDTKDNDCDGIADYGLYASWTGVGGDNKWENSSNWDQNIVPLPCQIAVINTIDTVIINQLHICKGVEIHTGAGLVIESTGYLHIDSEKENTDASAKIDGTMIIHGRCDVRSSSDVAFEVAGLLVNTNKLNTSEITSESILVKNGGRFESLGEIKIR